MWSCLKQALACDHSRIDVDARTRTWNAGYAYNQTLRFRCPLKPVCGSVSIKSETLY